MGSCMCPLPKAHAAALGVLSALLTTTALTPAALAQGTLPQGGAFVAGSGAIAQSGADMTVTQATQKGVINWDSFSIGSGNAVHFDNGGGATLNRVTGGDLSTILGTLSATGSLYLVNPQGVVIGEGGVITTGGSFVASALDMANDHFMAGGSLLFKSDDGGEVRNLGKISATGGNVVLIAREVTNDGTITAANGTAALAGGTEVLLSEGGALVRVVGDGRFDNGGTITAAEAELKAAGGNIFALAGNTDGIIRATGTETRDGRVWLSAGRGSLATAGTVEATNADGGGGTVAVDAVAGMVMHTGTLSASGTTGGSVSVTGDRVVNQGRLAADGSAGAGGSVDIATGGRYVATTLSTVSASGETTGGTIRVAGDGTLFSSGDHQATGRIGAGGSVDLLGDAVTLVAASVDASGGTAGGSVRIGGDFQGQGDLQRAETVLVTPGTTITADATSRGDGGRVIVWSDRATDDYGDISARAGAQGGDGGFIEVSSKDALVFGGQADAGAAKGAAGTLLLDPKNITISDATSFPSYELIDPTPAAGNQFGSHVKVLPSGNVVVTSLSDDTGATDAGAAYLYNGTTGALISTLTGSTANDFATFSDLNVTVLTNGNYVLAMTRWDNGGITNAGAVTWGNGSTGVSGVISDANSLVGTTTNDIVGTTVRALTNGNYVVATSGWDDGGTANVGAVTWGNGTTGISGQVSSANSLVGGTADDRVGAAVTALTNGNYVVLSSLWDNGGTADVGAVTWGNGSTGTSGVVSGANSLVGGTTGDFTLATLTALTNGNYVVATPYWDSGGLTNAGAATWGDGTAVTSAVISAANSLVGAAAGDRVGLEGVTALTNGNYVVVSTDWTNGGVFAAGAVTWGDGTTGIRGLISAGNSLVGSTTLDKLGQQGVTALANGNYVVASQFWDDGGTGDVGAVTWGNGATGTSGAVSAANSLVGSTAGDYVGNGGATALTNGNYVVASPLWDNGGTANVGAVTWGNGTTGTTGAVSATNSLFGGTTSDFLSVGVTALTNGNYVVASPYWDDGGIADVGAVTWGNGTTGASGVVSAANSLIGATASDRVGSATALTNGNYVVASALWDSGGLTNVGAVTWGDGTTGTSAVVSSTNSLVGGAANDGVGSNGVTALSNGNYVVSGDAWDNGGTANAGAVTWGNGTTSTSGVVSAANSLVGGTASALLTYGGAVDGAFIARSSTDGGSGRVYVGIPDPAMMTFSRAEGQTVSATPSYLTNVLNTGTAVVLQASNDITVDSAITVNNAGGTGGALTLQAGRSLLLNASIATDGGDLTLIANDLLANGVVDAQRDAGAAEITMAPGAAIDAGGGLVTIEMRDGTGKTNATGGAVSLRDISAGTISVRNQSTGGGVSLGGTLTASGTGNAIVLAADGTFTNTAGATALAAGNGRWLVYSTDPRTNTLNGLSGANYYGVTYDASAPGTIAGTDNRYLHSVVPTLTVTADAATKVYGAAVPGLTYAVSGLIGGDSAGDVLSGALSSTATANSDVGAYGIQVGTLADQRGYALTYVPGTLTVTKAPLSVTATDASRAYGAADPAFTASYSGFVLSQDASVLGGSLDLTPAATQASDVGTYAISGSGLTSGNYAITYTDGTLTVTKAPLSVTATDASRAFGAAAPMFTASYSGFVLGQDASVLGGGLSLATTAPQSALPGRYTITGSGLTSTNYAITYLPGTLAVEGPTTVGVRYLPPPMPQPVPGQVSRDQAVGEPMIDAGNFWVVYRDPPGSGQGGRGAGGRSIFNGVLSGPFATPRTREPGH